MLVIFDWNFLSLSPFITKVVFEAAWLIKSLSLFYLMKNVYISHSINLYRPKLQGGEANNVGGRIQLNYKCSISQNRPLDQT